MAAYQLYCFAQSGNAYKAALFLALAKLDWEPRFVDFFAGESRSPEFRELNEMGEVPVLVHGDKRLTQSGVILDYLVEKTGKFGPRSNDERREVLRWLLWDNHKLTSYTGTHRFLIQFAKSGETPVTEFLAGRMKTAFGILDKHLRGRDWIAADHPTIADISCAGYMFYDGELGIDWSQYPAMDQWRSRIRSLPGWVHPYELMPGHPLPAGS